MKIYLYQKNVIKSSYYIAFCYGFTHNLAGSMKKKILKSLEDFLLKKGKSYIFCKVCGQFTNIEIKSDNLREDGICQKCDSNSRKRHLASVLLDHLRKRNYIGKFSSLRHIPHTLNLQIYNVESGGTLHDYLKHISNYVCSEYFGPYYLFGIEQNGILNVDLRDILFTRNTFDYIISTEVFEHIPDPYKAFKEIHRILKIGGSHIFTVPFKDGEKDEIRSVLDEKEEIIHLMEPEYHDNPIRAQHGILVFTIFAKEMISKLEAMGFSVNINKSRNPLYGILGDGNLVFTATKM